MVNKKTKYSCEIVKDLDLNVDEYDEDSDTDETEEDELLDPTD